MRCCDGGGVAAKNRLFGIGSSDIDVGHEVCILLGCSVPVVLAPGKRKGICRVVGEAYVHGIMDGEAIHQPRREEFTDLSTKEFHLV